MLLGLRYFSVQTMTCTTLNGIMRLYTDDIFKLTCYNTRAGIPVGERLMLQYIAAFKLNSLYVWRFNSYSYFVRYSRWADERYKGVHKIVKIW
jgi:hypothetical protein